MQAILSRPNLCGRVRFAPKLSKIRCAKRLNFSQPPSNNSTRTISDTFQPTNSEYCCRSFMRTSQKMKSSRWLISQIVVKTKVRSTKMYSLPSWKNSSAITAMLTEGWPLGSTTIQCCIKGKRHAAFAKNCFCSMRKAMWFILSAMITTMQSVQELTSLTRWRRWGSQSSRVRTSSALRLCCSARSLQYSRRIRRADTRLRSRSGETRTWYHTFAAISSSHTSLHQLS